MCVSDKLYKIMMSAFNMYCINLRAQEEFSLSSDHLVKLEACRYAFTTNINLELQFQDRLGHANFYFRANKLKYVQAAPKLVASRDHKEYSNLL